MREFLLLLHHSLHPGPHSFRTGGRGRQPGAGACPAGLPGDGPNAYDCIQIHGGSGFMLEYACQRIYRDARITSIYEGTTQLQTVAAIRYVTNGSYAATLRDYETIPCSEEMQPLMDRLKEMTNKFEAVTNATKEAANQELLDFVARRLYEMAAVCVMSHLLIQDATKAPELFAKSAVVYLNYAEAEVEKHFNFIRKFKAEELDNYRK